MKKQVKDLKVGDKVALESGATGTIISVHETTLVELASKRQAYAIDYKDDSNGDMGHAIQSGIDEIEMAEGGTE